MTTKRYTATIDGKTYEYDRLPNSVYYDAHGYQNPNDKGKGYLFANSGEGTCLVPIIDSTTGLQIQMPSLRERIVEYYRNTNCDRYGQVGTINAHEIAKTPEEMAQLSEWVQLSTYYNYGSYKGFQPWGDFKCDALQDECRAAFHDNKSRQKQNNW